MLIEQKASKLPVERFIADMETVCGCFDVRTTSGKKTVWGGITSDVYAEIEMAFVATNLQQVTRTRRNIRQDFGENYFLIMQQEGRALMAQNDVAAMLLPGDFILIDSSKPSEFTFFGDKGKQISLHLPRVEIQERFGFDIKGGSSLSSNDPTAKAIRAVLAKALMPDTTSGQNGYLKEALFGLLGVFLSSQNENGHNNRAYELINEGALLGKALDYIEARFRDPEFSINEIAAKLGVSARQLQRTFANLGVTPTKFLLAKRLEYARVALKNRQSGERGRLISSIAYSSGFADLSYFNRRFREAFGCAPGAYENIQIN
ncbi:MAG: helix-turn-helix domain-containing protein [Rhizobiaceae bacterium]|nr:helix-turn-helix domain-containing protein [Rhizobiaceae bacterium]